MKLLIFTILVNTLIFIEALNQTNLSQQLNTIGPIQLDTIEINENLDANIQIANLTQLIYAKLNNLLSTENTEQLIKIESVSLTKPSQYFIVDEKKISYDQFIFSNIDLRSTDKQIDSEVLCATNQQPCQLKIELGARLSLIASSNETIRILPLFLTIEIIDVNDNHPAFLQDSIRIEIDLDNQQIWTSNRFVNIPLKLGYDLDVSESNQIQNYSIRPESAELFRKILTLNWTPTELLISLDASDKEFINRIKLQPVQNFILIADDMNNKAYQQIQITFKTAANKERKLKSKSSIFVHNFLNVTRSLNQTVIPLSFPIRELQAPSCSPDLLEFSLEQSSQFARDTKFYYDHKRSLLNLRILNEPSKAQVGEYQFKLVARCGYELNDTALIIVRLIDILPRTLTSTSTRSVRPQTKLDIVSALNDLEIKSTVESGSVFELVFKNVSSLRQPSVNDTYVTLAYLMGKNPVLEANKLSKFVLERTDRPETNVKDLIKINEMRNGLYAVTLKREHFNRIRRFNFAKSNLGVDYFIELKLSTEHAVSDDTLSTLTRYLSLRIPEELVPEANRLETMKLGLELSTTPPSFNTRQNSEFSLSFFNSVVLITVLSVVLILVGLGCFVVSLTLYVLSKFRAKKTMAGQQFSGEKMNQKNAIFNSSQLIEADSSSNNSESGIASGSQTRSTSSSSASSLMHQSLNESISKKHEDTDGPTIMVYDVMPSQQMNRNQSERSTTVSDAKSKPNLMDRIYRRTNEMFLSKEKNCEQQIYTISTSESGSYDKHTSQSLSSNNISPVTTTTITSGIESLIKQQKKGITELYKENNSSNLDKEKDIIYEWFMQNLNQSEQKKDTSQTANNSEIKVTSDSIKECLAKTSQLISMSSNSINAQASSVATSTPAAIVNNSNETFSRDYRDEIYRNSHLVLKNYTNANCQNNNYSLVSGQYYKQLKKLPELSCNNSDMSTYEARPFSLSEQTKECELIINQNSKLDSNFLSRPPPPMPPIRLESYMLGSEEMSGVKIVANKDDNGKISCV